MELYQFVRVLRRQASQIAAGGAFHRMILRMRKSEKIRLTMWLANVSAQYQEYILRTVVDDTTYVPILSMWKKEISNRKSDPRNKRSKRKRWRRK